jgi:folate-binding protein YgfZ
MLEHIAQPAPADAAGEYAAATTATAIFDHSDYAKIVLAGPDAPMFLGNLSTNDIKGLPPGGGCESFFCDSRAKALFQAAVYHLALPDRSLALWVETVPGRGEALFKHLDRYLISEAVEITDETERHAQYFLSGPTVATVLEAALGGLPPLEEFQHAERTCGPDIPVSLRRRDWLGMPGYDLVCARTHDETLWQRLTAAGAVPAGEETFHTLRIEAGSPFYGPDIDENRFVMEVGKVERAVSYSKGCYLGQEPIVMARDRAGHAPRSFVQMRFAMGLEIPANAKVFLGAEEIGTVTSVCQSPKFQATVALGYVRWKHREPGTAVEVEAASGRAAGEIARP